MKWFDWISMISSLATFQKGLWSTWLGSGPQRSASLAKDTHTGVYIDIHESGTIMGHYRHLGDCPQHMCHCNKLKSESWLAIWTLLISLQRKDVGLSEQADLVKTATLPFPIYNALNVKDGTSELVYNGKGICLGTTLCCLRKLWKASSHFDDTVELSNYWVDVEECKNVYIWHYNNESDDWSFCSSEYQSLSQFYCLIFFFRLCWIHSIWNWNAKVWSLC